MPRSADGRPEPVAAAAAPPLTGAVPAATAAAAATATSTPLDDDVDVGGAAAPPPAPAPLPAALLSRALPRLDAGSDVGRPRLAPLPPSAARAVDDPVVCVVVAVLTGAVTLFDDDDVVNGTGRVADSDLERLCGLEPPLLVFVGAEPGRVPRRVGDCPMLSGTLNRDSTLFGVMRGIVGKHACTSWEVQGWNDVTEQVRAAHTTGTAQHDSKSERGKANALRSK